MRFELIRLMVTKGSRDVKEGEYWAIKDNEEIEDYKNGYCCDLENYQPYGIVYGKIDYEVLCGLIERAEEEDEVGYLCEYKDIIIWEFMSNIKCYEVKNK